MTTDNVTARTCEHVVAACGEAYPKRFRSGGERALLGEIGLLDPYLSVAPPGAGARVGLNL